MSSFFEALELECIGHIDALRPAASPAFFLHLLLCWLLPEPQSGFLLDSLAIQTSLIIFHGLQCLFQCHVPAWPSAQVCYFSQMLCAAQWQDVVLAYQRGDKCAALPQAGVRGIRVAVGSPERATASRSGI